MPIFFEDETFDLWMADFHCTILLSSRKLFSGDATSFEKRWKLVIWDMVATTEELRETNDAIETMRDNSHTRILSREEFEALFEDALSPA